MGLLAADLCLVQLHGICAWKPRAKVRDNFILQLRDCDRDGSAIAVLITAGQRRWRE